MADQLIVSIGQYSERGRKEINQDFHGAFVPHEPQLATKGIAIALADGISSSDVSQEAAESAVKAFLEDYYCTSEAWSVRTAAERVLVATNSWLHSQTQRSQHRYDRERGYVCTFSGVVVKSTTAHLFHVGDARIYRLRGSAFEQLTEDHRIRVSSEQSYLSRALGMDRKLDIDYTALPLAVGDVLLLATDGVGEFIDAADVLACLGAHAADLDGAARALCAQALARGSGDNLTAQLVRIDRLPSPEANEMYRQAIELPCPPLLDARASLDGYRIVREIKGSSRSHIYLAVDDETGEQVALKIPATDLHDSPAALERFMLEEWIARRINSAHVLKPCRQTRPRHFLYSVSEYIEGETLAQWMTDHPRPDLATVRRLVTQIAKGLQAFHRLEMVHQDLKPDNVMIDATGTAKIIDFGATRVAGLSEIATPVVQLNLLGAQQYAAPEYFLGESGSSRSDIFSLGVIAYQLLAGRLPYGAAVPRARTRGAQRQLAYTSLRTDDSEIPAWVDDALRKAVAVDPNERYGELSEFVHDLHHPNRAFLQKRRPPLIERHPVRFWKAVSLFLAVVVFFLAAGRTHWGG